MLRDVMGRRRGDVLKAGPLVEAADGCRVDERLEDA